MPKLIKHLANIITITRMFGVVLIFWLTPFKTEFWQLLVVLIFTLIALTDFLDGWIARKLGTVTDVGKVLDPLADKILILVFLPLLEMQVITSFPVFIILAREFAIMGLRVVSAKAGNVLPAQFSGKLKTAITFPLCGILFGRVAVEGSENIPNLLIPIKWAADWVQTLPDWTMIGLIYLVVAVTIWSFLDYFGSFIWQQYLNKWNGNEEDAKRAIRSLIPNSFSFLNLVCGLTAVWLAFMGRYNEAVVLVIIGIFADAVDGSLARKLDAYSKFGEKLDSQADFTSFGIMPSVIIYKIISDQLGNPLSIIALTLSITYFAAVLFRLIRFNKTGHDDKFEGLPSPVAAGAIIVAAISTILSQPQWFYSLIIAMSILMISRFPYPHLHFARKKRLFKFLQGLGYLFSILTVLNLLKLPYASNIYAYELLFALLILYCLAPALRVFKY